jgi:hypothetical protein
MQEPAGELPYFAGQPRHQTTNLGVRGSNPFGRATYATGSARIIFMIGFCL